MSKIVPFLWFPKGSKDQAEVDGLLQNGGKESMCGWLNDQFGVRWQIIPEALGRCLGHPERERAGRAMQAMLKMQKIIVADLEAAIAD